MNSVARKIEVVEMDDAPKADKTEESNEGNHRQSQGEVPQASTPVDHTIDEAVQSDDRIDRQDEGAADIHVAVGGRKSVQVGSADGGKKGRGTVGDDRLEGTHIEFATIFHPGRLAGRACSSC